MDPMFRVEDYRSPDDPPGDDGPAIQRAVEAASLVGGTVYFEARDWVIRSGVSEDVTEE